jgi:arylsulfatase A-like enzyme
VLEKKEMMMLQARLKECVLIAVVTLCFQCLGAQATRRPNILYFYADDMGWGSIGPNGQDERRAGGLAYVRTPNLDRLAEQGINFQRAYGCTVCSPARSSQQTGFHQGHTWADRNNTDNAKKAIRADDTTMGDALKAAGYVTGYWGKWGYGASKAQANPVIQNTQTLPNSHGYDYVLAELHHVRAHTFFQPTLWSFQPGDVQMHLVPNSLGPYANNLRYPESPAKQSHTDYPATAYCDDSYAFAALDFIRTQAQAYNAKGTPFFALFAAQIPHGPYGDVSHLPEWDESYQGDATFAGLSNEAKHWAAMVTRLDAHFGNILAALDDPNGDGDTSDSVADNTIVIFQSDNGAAGNKAIAEMGSNANLRGRKGQIWEGGIRIPMVMRWPARITPNSALRVNSNSNLVFDVTDLLPTFCELARVKAPLGIDGISLASTLTGAGHQRRRDFVIHEAGKHASIIRGNHKLVRTNSGLELYDLGKDPTESTDISGSNATLVAELNTLLLGERVTEPRWSANTYHHWTGANAARISDPANWSDYTYENAGIVYDTDKGAPRIPWIAKMENKHSTDQSVILDTNVETLAIEIIGNMTAGAKQTIAFQPGRTLTGRNEIRLSSLAQVELNGGTLASTRWVDLLQGAVLNGVGTVDATLYHEGTLSIPGGPTGLTVKGDYHQSTSAILNAVISGHCAISVRGSAFINGRLDCRLPSGISAQPGERFTLLSADSVAGQFSNTQGMVECKGQRFRILYTADTVELERVSESMAYSAAHHPIKLHAQSTIGY